MRKVLATGLLVLVVAAAFGPLASTGNAEYSQIVGPNDHLYQQIDISLSWHDARDYCAALGAHLVTIGSLEENQFVYDHTPWGWLGATDEVTEGEWNWVTGERWSFEYWASGEPNNCAGPDCIPEHYLTFSQAYAPQWNDEPVIGAHYFVCEWGLDIDIDIKPGSRTNSIHLGSRGALPVAVLTTAEFDAGTVDLATVLFAGAPPVRWTLEDVDRDGDADLLLYFQIPDLDLDGDSTEATLTGETIDGIPVDGTDSVKIVP